MLTIRNATLFTPDQCIAPGAILIENNRITAVGPESEVPYPQEAETINATGLTAVPGFIDLQINGAFGLDFTTDPAMLWAVATQLPHYGVTAFLPTLASSPLKTIARAQTVLQAGPPQPFRGAMPLGFHLEGPFLHASKRETHASIHLRAPDIRAIEDWHPDKGIKLVTLAPELNGALNIIRALRARGVVVSAGHSTADYAQALAGIDAGISYGTHILNAMPPFDPNVPGLVGALLADPRVVVGVLADGLHLHPAVVKILWQCLSPNRLSLVSDAMAALGMAPGVYHLGEVEVNVSAQAARLADGRLAGSLLSLDEAMRNFINFTGCSLSDAVATITSVPARLLGLTDRGQLANGYFADVVLLDEKLQVVRTLVRGETVYLGGN